MMSPFWAIERERCETDFAKYRDESSSSLAFGRGMDKICTSRSTLDYKFRDRARTGIKRRWTVASCIYIFVRGFCILMD